MEVPVKSVGTVDETTRWAAGRPRTVAGFSLVEVMIAALLLAFIALGLSPLFMRAIRNNAAGGDLTEATNGSKSKLEESLQLPFGSRILELPAGQVSGEILESWAQGERELVGDADEGWWPDAPVDKGLLLWERRTLVQQYGMSVLDKQKGDFILAPDERLAGGSDPVFVHLKEVEVVLDSRKESGIFGGKRTVTRVLKPF